jgi:branched-chain amino acid transport system ATP-binding protein
MSVLENVMVGRHVRTRNGLWAALTRHKRAAEEQTRSWPGTGWTIPALRVRPLPRLRSRYGHQRRLEIARALAPDPPAGWTNRRRDERRRENGARRAYLRIRDDGKTC